MKHACTYANCTMTFDRPWKLRNHLARHNDVKNYKCSEVNCRKSYFSSSHLIRHIQTAHVKRSDKKEVFPCSFSNCNAIFDTMCGLQKHRVKHNDGFLCSRCGFSFRSPAKYENHIESCRNRVAGRWRECFLCKTYFVTKNDFKLHQQRAHTVEELSMFECAHCRYRFVNKFTLRRHLGNRHGFEKVRIRYKNRRVDQSPVNVFTDASFYECAYCQYRFTKKRNLKTHIQIIHQASRIFVCEVPCCCKVFLYKRNLMAHVRCDHERNLFQCGHPNCESRFKYKKTLINHMQMHELQEKH